MAATPAPQTAREHMANLGKGIATAATALALVANGIPPTVATEAGMMVPGVASYGRLRVSVARAHARERREARSQDDALDL